MAAKPAPNTGDVWEVLDDVHLVQAQVLADSAEAGAKWRVLEVISGKTKGDWIELPVPGSRIAGSAQWKRRIKPPMPAAAPKEKAPAKKAPAKKKTKKKTAKKAAKKKTAKKKTAKKKTAKKAAKKKAPAQKPVVLAPPRAPAPVEPPPTQIALPFYPIPGWSLTGLPDWLTGSSEARVVDPTLHHRPHPGDPKRGPRRKPRVTSSSSRDKIHTEVMQAFDDKKARTFNALSLELTGKGASKTADTPLDDALWELVAAGYLEHTSRADPAVLFRLRTPESLPAVVPHTPPEPGDLWEAEEQGVSFPVEIESYDPRAGTHGLVSVWYVRGDPPVRLSLDPVGLPRTQLKRLVRKRNPYLDPYSLAWW
jgi:hypothetical protein